MVSIGLIAATASLAAALSLAGIGAVVSAPATAPTVTCGELERRFDLLKGDITSAQLNTALFAAAEGGCLPLARRLLEAGASLEARDRLGAMPLLRAARAGRTAMVELFLARGAAIDARNLDGVTALYGAAMSERHAVVAVLLAKGADPNLTGPAGVAPLGVAAFKGNGRVLDLLLARGADPNAVDATGKSAITYAAARGFAEIVRRLLESGVDAKRTYGNDLTALMWAAGPDEGVGAGAALDVVALLLDAGAPIDAVDNRGRTALMTAAEFGHAEIVEALLAHGADRGIKDGRGKRAVDLATHATVREKLLAR